MAVCVSRLSLYACSPHAGHQHHGFVRNAPFRPRECCGNLQPEHRVNLRHWERQYSPKGFHDMAMPPNAFSQ